MLAEGRSVYLEAEVLADGLKCWLRGGSVGLEAEVLAERQKCWLRG